MKSCHVHINPQLSSLRMSGFSEVWRGKWTDPSTKLEHEASIIFFLSYQGLQPMQKVAIKVLRGVHNDERRLEIMTRVSCARLNFQLIIY